MGSERREIAAKETSWHRRLRKKHVTKPIFFILLIVTIFWFAGIPIYARTSGAGLIHLTSKETRVSGIGTMEDIKNASVRFDGSQLIFTVDGQIRSIKHIGSGAFQEEFAVGNTVVVINGITERGEVFFVKISYYQGQTKSSFQTSLPE
ncbi:MAG: hypothetical protein HYW70_02215 [Candidatus Nealsonbacteria bacterium]|nr:hypothetical protein [Candidatus Nealsonbacteria bacterium]